MQTNIDTAAISAFPHLLVTLLFYILFAFIYIAIIRQNKLGALSKGQLNGLLVVVLLCASLFRAMIVYKYSGHLGKLDILPIASDFISAWLIYRFAVKPLGNGIALGVCILFAMNPAVVFHASVSFQASTFFIMGIVVLIFALSSLRRFLLAIIGSILVLSAALLTGMFTFATFKPWLWIAEVIKHIFKTDNYATLNVFNLFALTGGNGFAGSNERMLLSYNIWGIILLAGAFIYVGYFITRIKLPLNLSKVIFILLLLTVSVFVLAPHMRISYLYPAIPLALFSYILTQDRRLLQLLFGFSVTHFINASFAHAYSETVHPLIPHVEGILMVTSLANVVLWMYLIYSGFDIFVKKRILKMEIVGLDKLEQKAGET